MHQRIAVDQFDRSTNPKGSLQGHVKKPGTSCNQKGSKTLATIQGCIAHRIMQACLWSLHRRQEIVKYGFDGVGIGRKVAFE